MSGKTWLQEFYPVPAAKCPADQALDHSIRKWGGLRPASLEKHGVKLVWQDWYDSGFFAVDLGSDQLAIAADSCALCARHTDDETMTVACDECEISIAATDRERDRYGVRTCSREFDRFCKKADPEPMIKLLMRTKRRLEKQK